MALGAFLALLRPWGSPPKRQATDMWLMFEANKLLGAAKDRIQHAAWSKLTVGIHAQHVYQRPQCFLFAALEKTRQAAAFYKFMDFTADVVCKAFGMLWSVTGRQVLLRDLLVDEPLLTVKASRGLDLWVALLVSLCMQCGLLECITRFSWVAVTVGASVVVVGNPG